MQGTTMDRSKLQALAAELAKDIKTEADLNALSRELLKLTVETALNAELTDHLGYEKHGDSKLARGNARNGTTPKRLKSQHGEVDILSPRDRDGSFEPQLLRKNQTRLTQMDDQILTLYAKGLSTREIVDAFKEMYDADVSATLISKVTDRVLEQITAWQSRPLDAMYPIVYLDCIVIKIRDNMRVVNKSIYLALGVNMEGRKELLGLWMSDNEGAKFWLSVLTELKSRGVQDILIACVDGLKGFPDAWTTHWPNLRTLFEYPPEIRKAIYTTNAVESLNSVIRAATKRRKVFPNDDSARKVIYLAIEQASRKWTMPIQNWRMALNRFTIEFGDRITNHQ